MEGQDIEVYLYADDTAVIFSANSDDKLQFLISQFLAEYQKWCLDNCIIINQKKTEYITFNVNKLIIIINNYTIVESSIVKYLGLCIDNNLN